MDKMIQTGNGEVTITNDGATILKQMSVIHPAAKMVCCCCLFCFEE
jgi:T-complex protein 1 subunit delta